MKRVSEYNNNIEMTLKEMTYEKIDKVLDRINNEIYNRFNNKLDQIQIANLYLNKDNLIMFKNTIRTLSNFDDIYNATYQCNKELIRIEAELNNNTIYYNNTLH